MKKLALIVAIILLSGAISGQTEKPTPKPDNVVVVTDKTAPKAATETGTLIVMVRGFKNTDGQLMVALFNGPANFPDKTPYKGTFVEISANEEVIKFENLPYGDYAVSVLHDMNNDGKMDKNILGIPTDGYGFSNNAMDKYGPPTFLQASFVFNNRDEARVIDLEYGIPKTK